MSNTISTEKELSYNELLELVIEDPSNLIKYQVTEAQLWAESLCSIEGAKDYDKGWMISWFANAIATAEDSVSIPDVAHKAIEVLTKFPVGTVIESADGTQGGTEVFIGNSGLLQPFSYLDDYNVENYRVKQNKGKINEMER